MSRGRVNPWITKNANCKDFQNIGAPSRNHDSFCGAHLLTAGAQLLTAGAQLLPTSARLPQRRPDG